MTTENLGTNRLVGIIVSGYVLLSFRQIKSS